MKKNLLFTFITLLACLGTTAQNDVTMYGYRTYQTGLGANYTTGPVKLNVNDPTKVTLINDQTKIGRVYSGAYLNYKWYALTTKAGLQSIPENLVEIDMETGKRTVIAPSSHSSIDMTYDYTTQKMFTIMEGGDALGTVDLKTGKSTRIGTFTDPNAVAIAASLDGTLYMISLTDTLYTVNKTTAKCTTVGFLGVNAAYNQSMAFDYNTGILYWHNAGDYGLYTVNTTTGKATAIDIVGIGDCLSSLFIPYTHVAKGAPERVTHRKAQADLTGANKVTLTWTNPDTDAQGNSLITGGGAGLSAAKIYRNGVLIHTMSLGMFDTGMESSWIDTNITAGKHSYAIVCENSKGTGGKEDNDIVVYVGSDLPGVVENFTVVSGDNTGILSWEKPKTGGTGGYFDPATLTGYKIVRSGVSSKTITIDNPATISYTDNSIVTFGKYTYTIYAINNLGEGTPIAVENVMIKPSDWIIMIDGTFNVDAGTFYDTGGPNNNHANSERVQMTLTPSTPNTGYKISFTRFELDTYGDTLTIYDGVDRNAPLIGKFYGSIVQDKMKEIYTSGAVTFYFYSDVYMNNPGWAADISTYTRKDADLQALYVIDPITPIADKTSTFNVSIKNLGKNKANAADYILQLLDENNTVIASTQGVDIASMESALIAIPYTPTEKAKISAKAFISFAKDEDTSNNYVNGINIDVQAKEAEWTNIGKKEQTAGIYPMSFYTGESYSQTLFPSAVLNKTAGGMITKIAYPYHAGVADYDFNVKIWMKETDVNDLSAGNIPVSEMTLVQDGASTLKLINDILVLDLATPFKYEGKNLIVSVHKTSTSDVADYNVNFYATKANKVYTWAETAYGEALDPEKPMGEYQSWELYPDISLLFDPTASTGIENGLVDSHSIVIYPNPSTDIIYIKGFDSEFNVTISDISGKALINSVASSDTPISVSDLSAGVYIVNVKTKDGAVHISKIIKK